MNDRQATGDTGQNGRGRGRPSIIDRDAVSLAALSLWDTQGLANTSWRDISEASGVSVRTLVRHFESKEDLAWAGIPAATERLKHALSAADSAEEASTAIRKAVVASLLPLDQSRRSVPPWLHTVAAEPTLRAASAAAHSPWIQAIAEFIAQRQPAMPPAVSHAIAVSYQVAAFDALLSWVDRGVPAEMASDVDSTLRWLAFQFYAHPGPSSPANDLHHPAHY